MDKETKRMPVQNSFTTVTPLSKTLAFFLLFLLPIIGFLFGRFVEYSLESSRLANSSMQHRLSLEHIAPLQITTVSPQTLSVGTQLTISGSGFQTENNMLITYLDESKHIQQSVITNVTYVNSSTLHIEIPNRLPIGCDANPTIPRFTHSPTPCPIMQTVPLLPHTYYLSVMNARGLSNLVPITLVQKQ